MENSMIRKGFVCVVVILFFNLSFLSCIHANVFEQKILDNILSDDEFDKKIENLMEKAHMPSLVGCIVKNNKTVFIGTYGKSRFYKNIIATVNTVYPIGCITKSFTATAIMQLNESGLIGLDDNVSEYLNFDLKNPKYKDVNITFRMLLAHQSSLNRSIKRFNLFFFWLKRPLEKMGEFFKEGGKYYNDDVWDDYKPGEGACYASTGYIIMGYIIEKITGQTLENYFQENIFKKLNMTNTSFYFSNFDKKMICGLYSWVINFYISWPIIEYGFSTPSGIKSTVLDLSNFLIMYTNGGIYNGTRILNESSINEMHSLQYPGYYDGSVSYGFGWYFMPYLLGELSPGNKCFKYEGHGGAHVGAWTLMKLRSNDNVGIILLSNQETYNLGIAYPDVNKARQEIQLAFFQKADEL